MKNIKEEKGITLIALIMTILVLIILAIVAIGEAKEDNIVGYAQNAVTEYDKAKKEEKDILDIYINQMATYSGNGEVNNQHGEPLKVGDFVKCGEEIGAVLYNDSKEGLQIMSITLREEITLTGIEGFENRINVLNGAIKKYQNDALGAINVRVYGYTFNELKNIELHSERELSKSDGSVLKIKSYGRGSSDVSVEDEHAMIVLNEIYKTNLKIDDYKFWSSAYSWTTDGKIGVNYVDLKNIEQENTPLIEYDTDTNVILAENSITCKILPIFLINQGIKITGGTGSYEDPYVYEYD